MKMEIKMETVVKRFRDYISFNTQSDEANDKECPSTQGQMVLAEHLAEELCLAAGLHCVCQEGGGLKLAVTVLGPAVQQVLLRPAPVVLGLIHGDNLLFRSRH